MKKILFLSTMIFSNVCLAILPKQITLGGVVYTQNSQNEMGSHKTSQYLREGETSNNWNSMVEIHQYVAETNPMRFARQKDGINAIIEPINGNENNVIETFSTMNTLYEGDTVIYEQNIWRYIQLSNGKGIMAVQYSQRSVSANNVTMATITPIASNIKSEIEALPMDRYEF